jgi:hypothetical protein
MPDPVTGVLAGASVIGGASNIFGAQSAAEAQKEAAAQANSLALQQQQKGLDTQKSYFDTSTKDLASISAQGSEAYKNLLTAIPDLVKPITMDQKTLEATPGYQWNLEQGIRGVNLSGVGSGLSGAQAKAAARYATGLADSTYQNQFNNANTNKQNAFNFLLNSAQPGMTAAGTYAAAGTTAGNAALSNTQAVGNTISGNTVGAGNAQAAADIATGKNIGNMFSGAAGAYASAPSNNPFGNYGMYGATNNPTKAGSLY